MRRLVLTLAILLLPSLSFAAVGYSIDINPAQSALVIIFLNQSFPGTMDGTLHCTVDPGFEDGATAVISDFNATVTDINSIFVTLRNITLTSDPLLPNSGSIVDATPGDGHVNLNQVLHLTMDATYDPIFGADVPFTTNTELCIGSTTFCGGAADGSGNIDTNALFFQILATGVIPGAENPTGEDIPFRLVLRGLGTQDDVSVETPLDAPLALNVWPNPSADTVAFASSSPAPLAVAIYDVAGRHIVSLSGADRVDWDGRDAAGQRAGAGVYLARYRSGEIEGAAKVLMLR
ncbi:MAG: hypothetical protein H6693_07905 [Candidatus Latescibacteria bacterium]|nr:hypothetical protein [Candidatus Latescibacterota bacterium]MCB9516103.1 hypothetical protein [Candidatus Latescibacterota bacterium]